MASLSKENYNPEEYLLDTLNDLDIGFVKVSNDGTILNHNLSFNKIFGYNPEKKLIDTKTLDYWLNPEESKKFREILFKNGIVKNYIAPVKKLDGEKIFLQMNFKLKKNSNGEVISSEGTFVDVSERIETEQKLKESEEKYRNFVQNIQGIAFQGYQDFSAAFFDGTVEEITGYTTEDFITGRIRWDQIIYSDDAPIIQKKVEIFESTSAETDSREYRIVRKNGEIRWVLEKIQKIYDNIKKMEGVQGIIVDITQRKKVEIELKESEEKFRTAVENSPDFMVFIKRDGTIFDVNRLEKGYTRELVIGQSVFNESFYETKDQCESARKAINDSIESGEINQFEYSQIAPDGTFSFYETIVSPFGYDKEDRIIFFQLTTRDMTERKKAEQKLKESEVNYKILSNELETILDLIPGMLFCKDGNDVVTRVNQNFADLLNSKKEDIIGKTTFDLFPKDQAEVFRKDDLEVINTEKPKLNIEEVADFPDKKIWSSTSKVPYYNDKGEINGVIGLAIDITERKKIEQELKESEEKYRNFIQNIQGIAFQGYQDFSIAFFDGAVEEITGYATEDFLTGRIKWDQIIYPDDTPINQKKVVAFHSSSAETDSREYRIVQKNGEIRWVLEKVKKIYDNVKKMEGVQGIFVDITQRKEAENELKELSKLKSEFLRRASHELKTPLISIKGFSELILALHEDQLELSIISKLREINDGCERLQNIINNLLKASRLESPELKPKFQKEDLSFLIKFCVHELELLAERRNQSIKLDIHSELYANIEKEEIHDVLSNLLTNAIKYTPPRGKIEIKTELKEDSVVVLVSDNGIGFTEEQKKKIFQQFGKIERYGQGLDLGIDGTGLGLYISKRIVESHGGKIWMESEGKSRGSTFYFNLPTVKK